jgi:hypothetical protein
LGKHAHLYGKNAHLYGKNAHISGKNPGNLFFYYPLFSFVISLLRLLKEIPAGNSNDYFPCLA